MQGTGFNDGRVTFSTVFKKVFPIFLLIFLILVDQITKTYLKYAKEQTAWSGSTWVIKGFFSFTYTTNSGAAWSFLSDKVWGQIFFKCLTAVALVLFYVYYLYVSKRGYRFLKVAVILVISGTIGNFIDRLAYNYVVDFLSFIFGSYSFPIFNLADSFMCVGVIMVIIHYLFLDNNALFKSRKNGRKVVSD